MKTLSIFIGLIILLTVLFFLRKRRRFMTRWRNSLALDKHQAAFQKLYASVNGFALSKASREQNDALEYIYGEIEFEPFIALLSLCQPNSETIFYDLGSGIGKAVLATAMVFNIKKAVGIELFESLHDSAQHQQQLLKELPSYEQKAALIQFIQGDFFSIPFHEANLVFINGSAFFGERWQALSQLLEQLKPGSVVVSSSKPVCSPGFRLLAQSEVLMSWGRVKMFIQERLSTNV